MCRSFLQLHHTNIDKIQLSVAENTQPHQLWSPERETRSEALWKLQSAGWVEPSGVLYEMCTYVMVVEAVNHGNEESLKEEEEES